MQAGQRFIARQHPGSAALLGYNRTQKQARGYPSLKNRQIVPCAPDLRRSSSVICYYGS